MFESRFRLIGVSALILASLALGACTKEIPPELLAAAASIQNSDLEELQIDLDVLREELEFVGEVQFISDTEWTIADLGFGVNPSTEIKGNLGLGDLAKVHASLTVEGGLLAREIEPAPGEDFNDPDGDGVSPFDLENEFEFVGIVETMGANEWAISERVVVILPGTEVKGTVVEGDLVKVHAFLNDVGELAAREIELASDEDLDDDDMDDDQDFRLIGVVEEIGDDLWVVDGVEIHITTDTEIQDEIKVGDLVEVYFFTGEEGISIAREIELEDDAEDDLDDDDDLFDDSGPDLDDDDDADDDHEESESDDSDDDHGSSDSDNDGD